MEDTVDSMKRILLSLFCVVFLLVVATVAQGTLHDQIEEVLEQNPIQRRILGGKKPGEKCLSSAGFTWCETTERCHRLWEDPCPAAKKTPSSPSGNDNSNDGKKTTDGSVPARCGPGRNWCETFQRCLASNSMIQCPKHGRKERGSRHSAEDCHPGEEYCTEKSRCIDPSKEQCATVPSRHHEDGAHRQVDKTCSSEVMGMKWCDAAQRCATDEECEEAETLGIGTAANNQDPSVEYMPHHPSS